MPPTRDYRETFRERAQDEPEFREELLKVAARCMLNGEPEVGRIMLRDFVVAAIGIDELSQKIGKSRESLEDVLSDGSDPRADDLLGIVAAIAEHEGLVLDVQATHRGRAEQLVAA